MNLKNYKGFKDLINMPESELTDFGHQLRLEIYEECMKNGGHLGSNLAITDLTVSLLRHFGYKDQLYLFDTSYQAYSFKRLTTRTDFYEKVHTSTGYSIFQEIKEGDPYSGGHTSISSIWASGYNNLSEKHVIEIIGDGSLATSIGLGGLLNFAKMNKKGLFILNDNKQGIGINQFNYLDWEKISSGMGYKYFEIKNGHDYYEMENVWRKYDKEEGPCFVKVNTVKAYEFNDDNNMEESKHYISIEALNDNEYGATSKFLIENYFNELLEKDKNAYIYLPGMVYVFGFNKLKKKYKNRIIDAGISEEVALIEACASANSGKNVYFMVVSTFFQRCYDQIVHDVIRNNSNLTIFSIGVDPTDIGDSHHGLYDLNMYNGFENVKIFQPSTTSDLLLALKVSKNYDGPKVIRLSYTIKISKEAVSKNQTQWIWDLKKESTKVLISYGNIYWQIKKYICDNNLNINLILAQTLNPLDTHLITNLEKKGYEVYTYENVFWKNNLASSIRAHFPDLKIIDFSYKNIFIGRFGMKQILKSNKMDFEYVTKFILK